MYQAIVTKWIGPTNTKGSRVKAKAAAGSLTVSWDHSKGVEENHTAAAKALASKLNWNGRWAAGGMPDDTGNVYVLLPSGSSHVFEVE